MEENIPRSERHDTFLTHVFEKFLKENHKIVVDISILFIVFVDYELRVSGNGG